MTVSIFCKQLPSFLSKQLKTKLRVYKSKLLNYLMSKLRFSVAKIPEKPDTNLFLTWGPSWSIAVMNCEQIAIHIDTIANIEAEKVPVT